MNYKIEVSLKFEREIKRLLKKYPSLKTEYAGLISSLKIDPFQGTPLANSCYKIRLANYFKRKRKKWWRTGDYPHSRYWQNSLPAYYL